MPSVNPHIAPVSRMVAPAIHGSRDIRMSYTSGATARRDWPLSHIPVLRGTWTS